MAQPKRKAVSTTASMPPPVGGLNAIDALAAMKETDAVVMENWFPQPSYVEVRNGYTPWCTGFPAYVESLFAYNGVSSSKLFAASNTAFYDATAGGAVGAAVVSGLTNARWEAINFSTPAGNFLYACNGVDKPRYYDGAAWVAVDGASTPAITGVTTTKLRNPAVWKNRLWFVEEGSFRAWYLPSQSIGGAAQSLDLGSVFRLGGKLQSIFTVSIDNASSIDDYICFLTTEGELAMYRGTDPASSGVFGLIGQYRTGRPIGRRCHFKFAADTVLLTADGFAPVSKLLMSNRDQMQQTLSYKILNLVNADVQSYSANFGWQGVLYPIGNKVIINVPKTANSVQYQYVMNTITGAWTKFTGWNAACFAEMSDVLYFGGSNFVAKCDTGGTDDGSTINTKLLQAFSYFGNTQQKMFKMIRPVFQSDGNFTPSIAINTDFANTFPTAATSYTAAATGAWDTTDWDVTYWAGEGDVLKYWISQPAIGFSAACNMALNVANIEVKLMATDFLFETGGVL